MDFDNSKEIPADTEVFNTYGEFSNDKLLQDYGFLLEQNAFNSVTLPRSMLAGRRFEPQLRFAAERAAMLGLTQAESSEEESDEGSGGAEGGMSRNEGLATFYELGRGRLPKALRTLLAVLSLRRPALHRARAWTPRRLRRWLQRRASEPHLLTTSATRGVLRAALRRRAAAYPKPEEAEALRRRWAAAAAREKAAIALRRSDLFGCDFALLLEMLSLRDLRASAPPRAPSAPPEPQAAGTDPHPAANAASKKMASTPVEIENGDVKTYDGDFRFYMDSNQDLRQKIESHYTGIDGLIESVPGTLAERRKKERKGLRKNRYAKAKQERREQLQAQFLSSRSWRS
ncbi:ABCF5 [Symbiodinium natans]|uniref:ABCF5 protein n=1 Tax=Symbiodinium natans TaxID=878477 RepID=A0A812RD74_9DINO|nr:ABCF5 [Symbiodinium natans]